MLQFVWGHDGKRFVCKDNVAYVTGVGLTKEMALKDWRRKVEGSARYQQSMSFIGPVDPRLEDSRSVDAVGKMADLIRKMG